MSHVLSILTAAISCIFSAPPLKLIDLPGLDQRIMDESLVRGLGVPVWVSFDVFSTK